MIDLERIRWDENGLVPVITQDIDGRVLMLAYANRDSLEKTLETGDLYYWSRSRSELWKKGEISGNTQQLKALHLDCDGDAILARVVQRGPACHTDKPTCFGDQPANVIEELAKVFEDRQINPSAESYVNKLLEDERRLRQKIGEEAVEVTLAASPDELIAESADLMFHLLLLLYKNQLEWSDVLRELKSRRK